MKKVWLIIIISILTVVIGISAFGYNYIYKPVGQNGKEQFFEVVEGESTAEIALKLKNQGFVRSPLIFTFYARLTRAKILPGIYYLKQNMSIPQIIAPMISGNVEEYKITTIEGWRIEEIAQYLEKKGIVSREDFLAVSQGKEGYLFPDTYRVAKKVTAQELINLFLENFYHRTENLKITPEMVTLASIVEREAKREEDRAKIAGVYQNRLDAGMKLDADPTVQYAKGNWEPLKVSDYKSVDSLYNTYLHAGLPPGPICNPGLASIEAAISPEKSDYYYFFHLADGTTIFSKTQKEHEENLVKYNDRR